jgi:hypothetical protein
MSTAYLHIFAFAAGTTLVGCLAADFSAPEDLDTTHQAATAACRLGDSVQAEARTSQSGTALQNGNTTVGSFDAKDYSTYPRATDYTN